MKHPLTIAVTWWGSGGHILPLISLLQTIESSWQYRQLIDNIYRFGEKKGMEYRFFEQYKDSFQHIHPQFIAILAGKYRRETIWISRWRNLRDAFIFPLGIVQSIWYILSKNIDIIFCKWGYVSLPVVIAAWLLRKKIYVHDSDTTPWLTTRLASRFATQNFSGFPDTLRESICVWQILSDGLVAPLDNPPFQLPDDKYIVLVAWGSLGAKKLYDGVLRAIQGDQHIAQEYVFVFINGKHIIDSTLYDTDSKHIIITDLITEQAVMWWLYARADLGIVRWWTTTLAECKLFHLPLVIVPLPVTHDQAKNAQYYVEHYGDTVISQNDPQFIDQLHFSLVKITKKSITISLSKIKDSIHVAKKTILDTMLLHY